MAKKMSSYDRAKAMIEADKVTVPDDSYQQDPEVVDAANSALHSAGNMQREVYKQGMDSMQAEQTAKEDAAYEKAKALTAAKNKK